MSELRKDYFIRDGFLVRRPRTVYEVPFVDDVGAQQGQPAFIARSTDLTRLVEFNDHAQQVLTGVRSLGLSEAS